MALYTRQQINIPCDQAPLGRDGHAKAIMVNELERFPGQALLSLKGIVGIAHGASSYHTFFLFTFKVTGDEPEGVLLFLYRVKICILVAFAAAVTINAAVAAAPVNIHAVFCSKPRGIFILGDQCFGRYCFH